MQMKTCSSCTGPVMDRSENPVVFDTLASMPIGFCSCDNRTVVPVEFNSNELRETYYLATEPTARKGGSVSLALNETLLVELGWIVRKDEVVFITRRGRRLFPLLLTVASELQA